MFNKPIFSVLSKLLSVAVLFSAFYFGHSKEIKHNNSSVAEACLPTQKMEIKDQLQIKLSQDIKTRLLGFLSNQNESIGNNLIAEIKNTECLGEVSLGHEINAVKKLSDFQQQIQREQSLYLYYLESASLVDIKTCLEQMKQVDIELSSYKNPSIRFQIQAKIQARSESTQIFRFTESECHGKQSRPQRQYSEIVSKWTIDLKPEQLIGSLPSARN
jgi:hypothetical protein